MSEERAAEDMSMSITEPNEGTPEEAIVDITDVIEEVTEALADVVVFKARAHGAHWNVKGPAFGAYHELFGSIYEDVDGSIDPLAEQLLKLDTDAPSTLNEFVERSTITPAVINSDDPQVLAADLREMNDMVLESLDDAFDCATDADLQGLANFLADRIDSHRKWAWQLKRSVSNAAETPVLAPLNPPEASEVGEDMDVEETPEGRGMRLIGETQLREQPELLAELRSGTANVIEQRHAPTKIEVRAQAGNGWVLEGLAAVFDAGDGRNQSQDLGGFVERIKRGAFRNVLKDSGLDVRALFNHSADMVLGRTTNGTLTLEETPRGLKYTVQVPDVTYARDLRVLIERGDITQSSFAFRVDSAGQEWADDPETGLLVRTITNFTGLQDVSPVTYPAYTAATAGVRDNTSDVSSEQGVRASAEEPNEQADDTQRRLEKKKSALALRERALRLRERELTPSNK